MSSDDTQTTTQRAQPWGPQAQALQYAFGQARNLYDRGPMQYFPGQTYVSPSGATNQALNMQQRLAQGGLSGASQAVESQLQSTIRGDHLRANPAFSYLENTARGDMLNANPHLDQMFGQAARQVKDEVNAAFGASGRTGSGAHADVLSRNLGDLANTIYGQNYAQERANQLGAAGRLASAYENARQDQARAMLFAPQYEQLRYLPARQLGQVGAAREAQDFARLQDQVNRYNFDQQAPFDALSRYLGYVGGGGYGGTTTGATTVPVNYFDRALSGADFGSSLAKDSSLSPWIGALAGGLMGLI